MNWKAAASKTKTVSPADRHSFPAFAPTVSEVFDNLKGLPEEKTVPNGTVLVEQGADPTSVYLICHGLVKLTSVCEQGRESVLGLRATGWYAGAVAVLAHRQSIYSVRTISECVVSRIPAEEFHIWLTRSAKMSRHFTQILCNELLSQSAVAQIRSSSAESRLSQFLNECQTNDPNLKTLDPLPMLKQMELAQLLAITPEHLSRLLRKPTQQRDTKADIDQSKGRDDVRSTQDLSSGTRGHAPNCRLLESDLKLQ